MSRLIESKVVATLHMDVVFTDELPSDDCLQAIVNAARSDGRLTNAELLIKKDVVCDLAKEF